MGQVMLKIFRRLHPIVCAATAVLSILTITSAGAQSDTKADLVRSLTSRVGVVVGAASECPDMASARTGAVIRVYQIVIKSVGNEGDRDQLTRNFNDALAEGKNSIAAGKLTCDDVIAQFADLERSIRPTNAAPTASISPPATQTASADIKTPVSPEAVDNVRGVDDREIRFGLVAPFTGYSRDLGQQMEIGIKAAFARANDAGGVNGRLLRLITADDGYEPSRTAGAMKQLIEKDQVLGFIGNVGTPTGAVAIPYATQQQALFFAPFTGANIFRADPPDHFIFNYRASYDEEMDATVRYLLKVRHIHPTQIAVFAQDDSYGDAGYSGVAKAFRALNLSDAAIPRFTYKRNTIDVAQAVAALTAQRPAVRAVIMIATYRAAAKFIEQTRDRNRNLIYSNISFTGSTQLLNELKLMGPQYAPGVIVTQVLPAVDGNSSLVFEYKTALTKYFPNRAEPDYISFEGYVAARILIEGLKQAGAQFDTEKLISALENVRNLDVGLGSLVNFGRAEHQASHTVWATIIDENGQYKPLQLK